jgi:ribonuclease Z
MKRILVGALGLLAIGLAAAYALRGPLSVSIMQRVITQNMTSSLLDELPEGLHVALCGAGSPLPDPERSGPCVAVIAGDEVYLVDVGSGSSGSLARMRIPQGRVAAVLLSHFHSDHIDGLGELMLQRWINGANTAPLPVVGPRGVGEVVAGFNRAYAQDSSYRVAHHGAPVAPRSGAGGVARPFAVPADGEGWVVIEASGLRITAFRVSHPPAEPAVGYRFDYLGRSALVSGDTKKSANLSQFADGIDLLVHEALSPELVGLIQQGAGAAGRSNLEKILADIPDYHTTPVEAAEIAATADAGHLLYYHIVPPLPLALGEVFLDGVDEVFDGPVTLGRDGVLLSLPVGSEEVELQSLL